MALMFDQLNQIVYGFARELPEPVEVTGPFRPPDRCEVEFYLRVPLADEFMYTRVSFSDMSIACQSRIQVDDLVRHKLSVAADELLAAAYG